MTSPESNASTPNWRHVGIGIALVAGFALMLVKLSSHRSTLAAADASASNAKVAAGPDETRAPQSQPEPIPVAVPGLNENLYSWKSGDVFRFDYSRTITLKQLGDDGKPTERVTEVSGFLIFEIKSVTPSGASARLRIDSPHVTLPEVTVYSSQYDDPELRQGKARAIARAMEGVLKTASWNVILGSTGLIYIESRNPEKLGEWFKDVENAAGWRRKSLDILPKLIEQDLGLKSPSHDRDILLYLGNAPQTGLAPADSLRARREILSSTPDDEGKTSVSFKRCKPTEGGPYFVPGLVRDEKISAELASVDTAVGTAVFDPQLGMIDTLNEDYTMNLVYKYGQQKLDQSVRVQYRLRRLAPPITKP